ncbi:unnamed protein product [Rotaria sordida]|uniref:Uncharacterized protein n=1 Tax=Rotaria sordida TaxID=392033 RepID=A0A815HD38_9BILA|nr:unnamed protein product [Rotaria sordida]CAF1664703.1 unnamed protein product [Rotaria sordida]
MIENVYLCERRKSEIESDGEYTNGGATLIPTYYYQFLRLSNENIHLFLNYFFNLVYRETNQRAQYPIGLIDDGTRYLPDLVDYFSVNIYKNDC